MSHTWSTEPVQALSKAVFGQKNRLAIMLAIAESDGVFTPTELMQRIGLTHQSSLQDPLRALEESGLITRLPNAGAARATFYRRNDGSSAWPFARELVQQALRELPARS